MAKQFSVGGHKYSCGRLNAFDQYDVARRFSPVLVWLGALKKEQEVRDPKAFAQAICAMSASLPRADTDAVLNLCLSVVAREQATGFAPMRAESGALMFQDIELAELLEIVWHVLEANRIVDFFAASPSPSIATEGGQPSSGSASRTA